MNPTHPDAQRATAEHRHADELAALAAGDTAPRPPGWRLSLPAVRTFILGDPARGVRPKIVAPVAMIERCMVTLATQRALLLVGEPGTAKSLLSELLAAAISGDSRLVLQGSAALTEEQIRYGWNYALLVAEGPTPKALVPGVLYEGMRRGALVRFEELTRCAADVQDSLLGVLSERVLTVPELPGDGGLLHARPGFNLIATANTRDRGVHEMSAALKRRFAFETVFPIGDRDAELALVRDASARLLAASGVPAPPPDDLLDVLVTTFRELRDATSDRVSATLSTAEAVSVAHAIGVRGWFLRGDRGVAADLVEALAGVGAKDHADDLRRIRRYLDAVAPHRPGPAWAAVYQARHHLPG